MVDAPPPADAPLTIDDASPARIPDDVLRDIAAQEDFDDALDLAEQYGQSMARELLQAREQLRALSEGEAVRDLAKAMNALSEIEKFGDERWAAGKQCSRMAAAALAALSPPAEGEPS